jgi:DNA topoisomerase IB
LPRVREVVIGHLAGAGLSRDRVLAVAIRLIDLGSFRPGGQEYAAENGTYGLARHGRAGRVWWMRLRAWTPGFHEVLRKAAS